MFLVEALLAASFGTAHDRQRAIGHMRQDCIRYREVIFGQPSLGHSGLGVDDLIRMGETDREFARTGRSGCVFGWDSGLRGRFALWLFGVGLTIFALHRLSGLILPQALECSL